MTSFEDRERAEEAKFAHEEKMSFDLEAKTSKIFGGWAAEQLGFSGAEASSYAMSVVEANLEEPGFDDVLRKVKKDFADKDISYNEEDMLLELDKAVIKARNEG